MNINSEQKEKIMANMSAYLSISFFRFEKKTNIYLF